MGKEVITTKQAISIMVMFTLSSSLTHAISSKAGQDFWVAYPAVIAFTLLIFSVYSRILILFPQKNLLDINKLLFGKVGGSLIYASYVYYAFTLCCIVLRHFSEFIQNALPETPQYAYAILMVVVSIYIAKCGIETMGRWCLFSLPIIVIIFIVTIVFSINLFDPQNLKPAFQSDILSIADNAFYTYTLAFGACVLFLLLFDSLKDSGKARKICFVSMTMGITIILLELFRNIMVLGVENAMLRSSASKSAVSIIQVPSFVERIEVIIIIIFILCGLVKTAVLLMAASKGAAKLLNLDSSPQLVAPLGLLSLALSFNFFENAMQLNKWVSVYRLFFLPTQIIFPIATWIVAEIKVKRQKIVSQQK